MQITLAYPYDGHAPDETIDVDDQVGKTLIRDGFARLPDRKSETVAELRDYARANGIDLAGATKKDDIVAAIQAAEQTRAAPTTTVTPAAGADTEES